MQQPLITVIGGSGFVGRYIVRQLCQKGYRVRVICRNPSKAEHLKPSGNIGQIAIERADVTKPETLEGKLDGSHAVIYLPGLLYQSGRQRFKRVHVDGARRAAAEAATAGAERFIFVSALAVDNAKSNYAKTKIAGEDAVREAFPNATVLRPSLVIGAEDGFFQRFARMNMVAPALPLIAGGKTRFQPVYVEDVAQAAVNAIACPNANTRIRRCL